MMSTNMSRLRLHLCSFLLALACAACTQHDNRPAPPETAAPAPAPAVTPAEDRGQQQAGDAAAPATDENAFSNVDNGEAERAASKRGHDSAGEPTPATEPRSGE
jgi:hypothetical protein